MENLEELVQALVRLPNETSWAFQWMKENAIVMGRTFRKYAKW